MGKYVTEEEIIKIKNEFLFKRCHKSNANWGVLIPSNKLYDTNDWFTFSTTPQKEEDIRIRSILSQQYNIDCICISYICKNSILSKQFLKELMFITSNLFDFKYYNERYIDFTAEFYTVDMHHLAEKAEEIIANNPDIDPLFADKMREVSRSNRPYNKVDWFYIEAYQKHIDKRFIKAYTKNWLSPLGGVDKNSKTIPK